MTQTPPPAFLTAAKDLLGPKGWSDDAEKLAEAAAGWRGFWDGVTPFLAMPSSTEEAAALVKLCAAHRVPMTPQGGNTGLVDGGTPHGEIVVSMRRMNSIRSIDPLNNSLSVDAAAPLVSVQQAAADADRLFPLSLGSEGQATIGGLVSTNAGGVAVLRYGMMRDLILGLEVVLPSGEIWDGMSALRKDNTGYDLKHLFAGAEGTLGLITGATLKLFPRVAKATAWVSVETAEDIINLLSLMRTHAGDTVTSFEMIPVLAAEMVVAENAEFRDPAPSDIAWRVLVEISMADETRARATLEAALGEAFERGLAVDALIAENLTQAGDFWRIRESIPLTKRAFRSAVNHDISVPISAIPAFLIDAEAAVKSITPEADIIAFGHVGDGNLHYSASLIKDEGGARILERSSEIISAVHACVLAHGGSISAEHGVGRMKRDELAATRPKAATETMRAIKLALDPLGIMNPGRVISVD